MNSNNTANHSIGCTVTKCKYHCNEANYCTLDQVLIGTHESDPKMTQCVDCESYVPKN